MKDFYLSDLEDCEDFFCLLNLWCGLKKEKPVFLCIGTKKVLYDSFGPVMGSLLKKYSSFYVYGSLKREVNGLNFYEVYKFIKKKHTNSKIIVIDNAYIKNAGNVKLILKNSGVFPSGINNSKNQVGDVSILINGFSYNSNKVKKNYKQLFKMLLKAVKILSICFE